MNSEKEEKGRVAEEEKAIEKQPEAEGKQENDASETQDLYKTFSVKVTAKEIDSKFEETALKYASEVKLPGFRQGKVPTEVVKSRFKEAIMDEVVNQLVEKKVFAKIDKEKLKIAASPVVENIKHPEGKALTAEIKVEVFPEVVLPDLETIEVEIPAAELKLDDYNEQTQIDRILDGHKRSTPVTGREIRDEDVVGLSLQSKLLDTKRMTPRKVTTYTVNKEEPFEIMDIYPDILGKNVGDKLTLKRKYPEDFKKKTWAGKEVEHYLEIKSISEMIKPEFNQEFVKNMGFEDEETFKKKLKEEFDSYEKNHREEKTVQYMVDKLSEAIEFPVPESMIDQEVARMLGNSLGQLNGLDESKLKEALAPFRGQAAKNIRFSFITEAIEKEFKIEVSNEDLEKEYEAVAERAKAPLKEIKKYYRVPKNSQQLKETLLRMKVMDFIKEKVKIKEV